MSLTRDVSNRIKGIAIILMIMTHTFSLFGSNSGLYVIPLFNTGITIETMLGRSADICIYLFAFISGFGLFFSYSGKSAKKTLFGTAIKLLQFLLCYWLVIFSVFLPFYAAYQGDKFQFIELIKTMFGHHGFFGYGWYVYFYILLLISFPLVCKVLNINKWASVFISYVPFIGTYIVLNRFQQNIPYYDTICILLFAYSTACIGYSFSRHNFLSDINKVFKNKKWLILLVSGTIGFASQIMIFGYFGKAIIQPFSVVFIMVFLTELFSFNLPNWLDKSLKALGNNSMNMWYIHYIFFCPYIIYYIKSDQWILFSKIGIIAVIICTVLSLILAIPFTYINNKIFRRILFNNTHCLSSKLTNDSNNK